MVGFYYAAEANQRLGSPQDIKQKYKQAGEWYLRAANRYPKDDELFICKFNPMLRLSFTQITLFSGSLKAALDNISKASSSSYRTLLKIMEDIRQATPEVQKIWENSAMAKDGKLNSFSLRTIATTETELRKAIRVGKATLDTIYITPGDEATYAASIGNAVEPVVEDIIQGSKVGDKDLPGVARGPRAESTPPLLVSLKGVAQEQGPSMRVEAMPLPTLVEVHTSDAEAHSISLSLGDEVTEDIVVNATGLSTDLGDVHLPSDLRPPEDISEAPVTPIANQEPIQERTLPQVADAKADITRATLSAEEHIPQPWVLSDQAEGAPSPMADLVENQVTPEATSMNDRNHIAIAKVGLSKQKWESDTVHTFHKALPATLESINDFGTLERGLAKEDEKPATQAPTTSSTDPTAFIASHPKEVESEETYVHSNLGMAGPEPFSDVHNETAVISDIVNQGSDATKNVQDEVLVGKAVPFDTGDHSLEQDHESLMAALPMKSGYAINDSVVSSTHVAKGDIPSDMDGGETVSIVGESAPVESTGVPKDFPPGSECTVTQEPTLLIPHVGIPSPSSDFTSVPAVVEDEALAAKQNPISHVDSPSSSSNLKFVPIPATDAVDSTQVSLTADRIPKSKSILGPSFSMFGKKMGRMFRKQNE